MAASYDPNYPIYFMDNDSVVYNAKVKASHLPGLVKDLWVKVSGTDVAHYNVPHFSTANGGLTEYTYGWAYDNNGGGEVLPDGRISNI